MEQKKDRLNLSKQESKEVSLFSFPSGHRVRLHFSGSLAGRCPIWLTLDLWTVGRIHIVFSMPGPLDVQKIFSLFPAAIQMGKVPSPERTVDCSPGNLDVWPTAWRTTCRIRKLSLGVLHEQKIHLYFVKPLKCWILVKEVVNLLWQIKQWSREVQTLEDTWLSDICLGLIGEIHYSQMYNGRKLMMLLYKMVFIFIHTVIWIMFWSQSIH